MVVCLGWGADLHMAQLMPLPLTISYSSKSRLVLPSSLSRDALCDRMSSVCLSVCLWFGGSGPHRLKILDLVARTISPKVIHLSPGEHGEILGRKCSFNTYVHNVQLNWVMFNRESSDLRWRCGCLCLFTFVGASHSHLCDSTAFLFYLSGAGSPRLSQTKCRGP